MSRIKVMVELQFDDETLGDGPYEHMIPAAVESVSDAAHRSLGGMDVEIHISENAVNKAVIHTNNPKSPSFGVDYIPGFGADCDNHDDRDHECTFEQSDERTETLICRSDKCPKGTEWMRECGFQKYGGSPTVVRLKDIKDIHAASGPEEAPEKIEP